MPKYKTFSVWDNEIGNFCQEVADKASLSKEALLEWFYSDGLTAFMHAQSIDLNSDISKYTAAHPKRPPIFTNYILGSKFAGFIALLPLLLNKFVKDDQSKKAIVEPLFNSFVIKAVGSHIPFYEATAAVATKLNEEIDSNSKLSNCEQMKISIFEFISFSAKTQNTEVKEDIAKHLFLLNEILVNFTAIENAAGSSVVGKGSSSLFGGGLNRAALVGLGNTTNTTNASTPLNLSGQTVKYI